jgi:hypothetical protein
VRGDGGRFTTPPPSRLPMADVESWQIAEAIRSCGGMLKHTAAKLHVHRNTLYRRLRREPELRDIVVEERENFIDDAESVLKEKLKEGNLDAAKFVLTQLGAGRGYRGAPGANVLTAEEEEAMDQRTQPVDLKRLTNEELEVLETLLRKAAIDPPEPDVT